MRVLPIVFFLLLFSCDNLQPRDKQDSLARVGKTFLPQTELTKLGLQETNPEDSTRIVDAYINNWIRQEAYLQYAKTQLTEAQLADISKKVEDYQQSLFTHLFESQMIAEKLDTAITQQQIEEYYNAHQQDFTVNEPVLRFILIKKDKAFTDREEITSFIDEFLENGNDAQLKEYCTYNAVFCNLSADKWLTQSAFYETFGDAFSKQNIKLNSKKLQAVENQDYYYLCKILEQKNTGIYPIEFVEEEIKKNMIRKRENEFVENLRNQIIDRAKQNNEIEIYESE